ncbi:hypothetical protein [Brevibacterium luteolum]|uniref:DUF4878 domain-containing protein n=1 Tax=Brevibacterium luteolum TaxID=199591 RepID=A0A6G8KZH3_9MICO|nr:hypothetical protein [Brevibacterium luteolum]QIN30217.1 hypothetical protein EW640_13820 [Brevibacterium luteolum]
MARQPTSRRRRALLPSVVVGAVVVALIAAIVWFTGLRESSPAGTVRDYLSKLAAGDAAGALAMAEHDIPAGESTLLTDEVLAGADRIEQVEITGTETKGDTAVVTADYRLGLGLRTTEFTLHRAGRKDCSSATGGSKRRSSSGSSSTRHICLKRRSTGSRSRRSGSRSRCPRSRESTP